MDGADKTGPMRHHSFRLSSDSFELLETSCPVRSVIYGQFFGLVVTVPHCRGCTPRGGGSSLRCLACWGPLLAYHDHDHDSGGEDG